MNNFEVALAKEACLACGTLIDGPIIMNSKLTKEKANKVKDIHGKCIGFSDKLCPKCEELASKGLLCCEIDANLSKTNNPYRTGKLFVLNNDSDLAKEIYNNKPEFIIKRNNGKFVFIDKEISNNLGL